MHANRVETQFFKSIVFPLFYIKKKRLSEGHDLNVRSDRRCMFERLF